MAKFSKSISFKGAQIDFENDVIFEVGKDSTKTYTLSTLLKEWSGIDGLSINFKKDDELASEDVDSE
ncbi:MAG: YonK family protein [Bacteroidaceae bacterium]